MSDSTWRFVQSFGDDNSSDDDLVTAVAFDDTGNYVAAGDKAGRICIFEAQDRAKSKQGRDKGLEFKFYAEFQSHNPEFDCLKSLEIEEKVNMIEWLKPRNNGLFLLASNDKTIKLWKIHDKKFKQPKRGMNNQELTMGDGENFLKIPRLAHYHVMTSASPKRVFANAHGYHINSVSVNSDGDTFLSADDLRINIWNADITTDVFNVIDLKPPNLEELTEVITTSSFHPKNCNTLMYATSRGCIRLADLRDSALCDHHSRTFEVEDDPAKKNFFSEIVSCVGDAVFTPDGRHIVVRDYLTLKIWDMNMERAPIATIPIHDYLSNYLCDLYGNDCIFDKFQCASNSDGTKFVTGSYNNNFIIHDMKQHDTITIEALKDHVRPERKTPIGRPAPRSTALNPDISSLDFGKKAMHCSWHPSEDIIAIAGLNKLYIYSMQPNIGK